MSQAGPATAEIERYGAATGADRGARWYVVLAQPHREAQAGQQLANQGFGTFLPCRMKTVRHARKLTTVRAPFFPRYLFVTLDLSRDRWRAVNSTIGVSRLLMRGELPEPVPHGIVETLIASADDRQVLRFVSDLAVGGRVRLLAGPFAEQLGILERLDSDGSVRVLLNIMSGVVPIRLRRELVMPAD